MATTDAASGFPLAPPRTIRFVNTTNLPPAKRRRIRAACLTCRKRKTKCGGERPTCETCHRLGHECLGYFPRGEVGGDGDDEDDEDPRRHAKSQSKHPSEPVTPSPAETGDGWKPNVPMEEKFGWPDKRSPEPLQTPVTVAPTPDDTPPISAPSVVHAHDRHQVPYFRCFGPTAIVPSFKQMVVSVRDRKRSGTSLASALSPGSGSGTRGLDNGGYAALNDLPVYDPNNAAPVDPLILHLVDDFFHHLGSNYPFLQEVEFKRRVYEKRAEAILVDAVCALAARFSKDAVFTCGHETEDTASEVWLDGDAENTSHADRGAAFAQRAKVAIVDTFPCPSVAAVQACLLMAYEGFGADHDSALWMYLGCAIRMAVDLGLQKNVGVRYQGRDDPWYMRNWARADGEGESGESGSERERHVPRISPTEQRSLEQERCDTFWAVFVLDRAISSGTGRPVTFRDGDFELPLPQAAVDHRTGLADPMPLFVQTIHLYGRASDVLNSVRGAADFTSEKLQALRLIERDLTAQHRRQHPTLAFNPTNFTKHCNAGLGTTFMLAHIWFHALIIILHQPTLVTLVPQDPARRHQQQQQQQQPWPQLSSNSLELAMSSARTIADMLAFSSNRYIFETPAFVGNPFTSQPIYIAACAFLQYKAMQQGFEGAATSSVPPSKLSQLASAYKHNYKWCYNSLRRMHVYWGGVKYILTALDQKAKGIWDCETFTREEYEAARLSLRGGGKNPPIAITVAGTLDSLSGSLTVIYQHQRQQPQSPYALRETATAALLSFGGPPYSSYSPRPAAAPPLGYLPLPSRQPSFQRMPAPAPTTPPGNMVYDPIRQSLSDSPSPPPMTTYPPPRYPPTYPQPLTSALRHSPHPCEPSVSPGGSMVTLPHPHSLPLPTPIRTHLHNHTQQPHQAFYPPTTVAGVGIMGADAERLTFDSREIDIHQLHSEMVGLPRLADHYSDDMLALAGFFATGV